MTKTRNIVTNNIKLADKEIVIARIRYYMSLNRISTVTELGERIGLKQDNMSKKMLGKSKFSLEEAVNIAACLNVEFGKIFFANTHDDMLSGGY